MIELLSLQDMPDSWLSHLLRAAAALPELLLGEGAKATNSSSSAAGTGMINVVQLDTGADEKLPSAEQLSQWLNLFEALIQRHRQSMVEV